MAALESFADSLAGHLPASGRIHTVLQAHLTGTVGAWVAGAATNEGRALLACRSHDDIDIGDAAGAPATESLQAACTGALDRPADVALLVGQIRALYPTPKAFA